MQDACGDKGIAKNGKIAVQNGKSGRSATVFQNITVRRCENCERSIEGYRTDAKFCTNLCRREAWGKKRKAKAKARRASYPIDANKWCDDNSEAYKNLVTVCFDYRFKIPPLSIAGVVELARSIYSLQLKNAYRPYIRERILREYPSLEGWLK